MIGRAGSLVKADADGRFELWSLTSGTHQLAAFIDAPAPERAQWTVRTADIVVEGEIEPIRLGLEPPRR